MDKRLDQIKEGAGLEESRINEELVEFLKKHSDKFTLIILLVAVGIVGQKWWHSYQINAENDAWADYTTAAELGPQNLIEVANKYDGRVGLRLQALLDAADQYLNFVRLGLAEVAAMDAMNRPEVLWQGETAEQDRLTDEQRAEYLAAADELYARVVELAGADPARRLFVIEGLYGRAAVAEEKREFETSAGFYGEVKAQAEGLYPLHVQLAQQRLETLESLHDVVLPVPAPSQPRLPDLNLPGGGTDDAPPLSVFEEMLNQPGGEEEGPPPLLRRPDEPGEPPADTTESTESGGDGDGAGDPGGADGSGS